MAYTPKENEWIIPNVVEDGLTRVGVKTKDGDFNVLQYKIVGGNYEPIAVSHQPKGFSSKESCAKQANSLIARSQYDELKNSIHDFLTTVGKQMNDSKREA